jgi:hypothetical protein
MPRQFLYLDGVLAHVAHFHAVKAGVVGRTAESDHGQEVWPGLVAWQFFAFRYYCQLLCLM